MENNKIWHHKVPNNEEYDIAIKIKFLIMAKENDDIRDGFHDLLKI